LETFFILPKIHHANLYHQASKPYIHVNLNDGLSALYKAKLISNLVDKK
jgi:hypothetical protein